MSKELKNITDTIMDQIKHNEIKMRPKAYFVFGSILTFIGLVSSIVFSIFLFGLIRFSLRSHGPMGDYRLDQILSNFPWLAVVLAIIGLITGILLLSKYDFSFKFNFKIIIIGFILSIIVGGWVTDIIGLNDVLIRKGPMKGIMRNHYLKIDNNLNYR